MTFEVSAGRAVTPQEGQIGARPTSALSPSLMRVIIPGEAQPAPICNGRARECPTSPARSDIACFGFERRSDVAGNLAHARRATLGRLIVVRTMKRPNVRTREVPIPSHEGLLAR